MRGAPDIGSGRRDAARIELRGRETVEAVPPRPRTAALVMTTLDGGHRRRVAIGPADRAELLADILDGRRGRGPDRELELVALDGNATDLVTLVRAKGASDVYVVLDGHIDHDVIATLGGPLLMDGVGLHMVLPDRAGPPIHAVAARLGPHACVSLRPLNDRSASRRVTRALDVLGAAVLLVLLAPLLALVALLVAWRMGRPVIFRQKRLGQFAIPFALYKFRSMVPDADDILHASPDVYRRYVESNYKLLESEDPRITPLGRLLRRTSLDELPQLWNVLRGEMTLVGPRPIVPEELAEYGEYGRMLLRAKPGLTGAWQVGGRSDIPYPERARMDLRYVASRSLGRDVAILLRTVPAVLRRRGAL
ncbi:MAG TPA: sugar transferase [Candidatus Binatia bacterium]|nr:sugar transferase [Candidatus Binatia bacterium]